MEKVWDESRRDIFKLTTDVESKLDPFLATGDELLKTLHMATSGLPNAKMTAERNVELAAQTLLATIERKCFGLLVP